MKRLCTALAIALAAACAATAAPAPRAFRADVTRPAAWQTSAYRGETLAIEARLVDGAGRPFAVPEGASASLLWSTNGADWFDPRPATVTTGGVVRAEWTPDMDCGAASYRVFLRVDEGGDTNVNYGANLTLRMLGSPGPDPAALPLPVRTLDFAAVAALNAPWATPADVAAATNGIRTVESDPLFSAWAGGPDGTNGLAELAAEVSANSALLGDHDGRLYQAEQYIQDVANQIPDTSGFVAADDLGSAAFRDATDFATRADEQLLAQLVMGSNVVVEVTNYNSRVRAPAARILQLSETNGYVQVWAETNGLARTLAAATAYADALAPNYAPRAWSRTTSGLGAEAPSNTTWISTPTTVVAGGYEYAKVVRSGGESWVLCSNGMGLGADTNGYLRIETGDGEALLSVERTESVLVGVDAAGITVQGNTVTIPVPVVSQDPPVCYAARALTGAAWADLSESTPDWIDSAACTGSSGSWTWTITTDAPAAFFQFRVLQPGATVIRHHGWTDLSEGVIVNGVRYVPTTSGDTLTFTRASGQ